MTNKRNSLGRKDIEVKDEKAEEVRGGILNPAAFGNNNLTPLG